jgi:hypothetical protein
LPLPSDFLIQAINLESTPQQAKAYVNELTAHIKEPELDITDIAQEIEVNVAELEQLVIGTHPQPNELMGKLWKVRGWHPETLILEGTGWM